MEYILLIDTDSYAGNFERELTGWVMGWDYYGELYDKLKSEESVAKHPELEDYFKSWRNLATAYEFDEEYGKQVCGILATPGARNYNTVGIAVRNEHIDAAHLVIIKQMVEEFAVTHNIKILGYRMKTVNTVVTESEYIV
jgi:hypothetical protein